MKNVLKILLAASLFVLSSVQVFAIPLWMHGEGSGQKIMLSNDFSRLMSPNSAETSAGYFAKKIVKALVTHRKSAMRDAFSVNTLKAVPDLQDQIDYVFSLYEGEFQFWGDIGFASESNTGLGLNHKTICKAYYTIKTDKAEYEMFLMCYKRTEVSYEDMGIITLRFYKVDDMEALTEPVSYKLENGIVEMINERDDSIDFKYKPGIFIPSTKEDDLEKSREQMNFILECIKNKNQKALEQKFCKTALNAWQNKSQEMQEVFDLFKGDVVSCKAKCVVRDSENVDEVYFSPLMQVYEVETTLGDYVFYIKNIDSDYDSGLYTVRVINREDREKLYATWTRMRPGAYVPVGFFDIEYR